METEQLVEKYKKSVLTFNGYYKYTFYYENEQVFVAVGGVSDDIYRAELKPSMTLEELINECGDEFLMINEKEKSK